MKLLNPVNFLRAENKRLQLFVAKLTGINQAGSWSSAQAQR